MEDFLLTVLLLALIAAPIALHLYRVKLMPVTLLDVTPPYASMIVASLLEGVTETKFGFPSGIFRFRPEKSIEDEVITVQEMMPAYSVTDGIAVASTGFGVGVLADADSCVEGIIGMMVLMFITGPIVGLNMLEKVFRKIFQSEVRATLTPVFDPNGTQVLIELRGVNAFLLKKTYEEALSPPLLPEDIAEAAGLNDEELDGPDPGEEAGA